MHLTKTQVAMLFAAASVLVASSCVNEEYDLNNGIDTTVDINGDISAPLGSTEQIKIGDFLEIEEGSVIQTDDNGDYVLKITGDPIEETITVPSITLNTSDIVSGGGISIPEIKVSEYINDVLPPEAVDAGASFPLDGITVGNVSIPNLPATTEISINEVIEDLSSIESIRSISVDAPFRISMSLGGERGALTVRQGFSITFPKYIGVEMQSSDSPFILRDGHILELGSDSRLSVGSPFDISLVLKKIDVAGLEADTEGSQGLVKNGDEYRIVIDQKITVSEMYIDIVATDFGETLGDVPSSVSADITMDVDNLVVTGAEVVFSSVDVEDPERIAVGEVPEFLTGDNISLDVYNPVIRLEVKNSAPVTARLNAVLQGYDIDGNPTMAQPIDLGKYDFTVESALLSEPGEPLPSTTVFYISRRAIDLDPISVYGVTEKNIVIENLADIVKVIPHEIGISGISVVPEYDGQDSFTSLAFPASGQDLTYEFNVYYDIDVPLAFGSGLHIEYPYDITGLNETLNPDNGSADGSGMEITLNEAVIKLTFVNAIPLNMTLTASPIDVEGNVIPESKGLNVELISQSGSGSAVVGAGNIGSASESDLMILVNADIEAVRMLDGFRLNITGSAGEGSLEGVALNEGQYVQIKDLSVRINGGVEIEL